LKTKTIALTFVYIDAYKDQYLYNLDALRKRAACHKTRIQRFKKKNWQVFMDPSGQNLNIYVPAL
jgi:hypothetical protein